MPAQRDLVRFGQETRPKRGALPPPVRSEAEEAEIASDRAKCERDFKWFYLDILANTIKNRVGLPERQSLSRVHDFLIDFLQLEELKGAVGKDKNLDHSGLVNYLPPEKHGEFEERWLYWKTLNGPPLIQDGEKGPLSEMFYNKARLWQGLLICIRGDGLLKAILMPRGTLKSTLCSQAFSLWKIIREPSLRTLIRSLVFPLARSFVADIKFQFEQNPRFRRLYSHLGPPAKRELPWNADFFQVHSEFRRGKEPTLWCLGMESEITGGHFDHIILDDVVGESNTDTPELRAKARLRVQRLFAVKDPYTPITDIGTRWEEDDVHSMFADPASEMAQDASFLVCTILDGDENSPAPSALTPLGYGKSVWPEKFTMGSLVRLRHAMPDDRLWFGQYFNQFAGTSARTFRKEWEHTYEGIPEEVAEAKQLNIFVFFDLRSPQSKDQHRSDYDAGVVLGQTPDRSRCYLLDGFRERVPAALVGRGIVDLCLKWKVICGRYGGTFRVGVEETRYTNFLEQVLDAEKKARGLTAAFGVELVKRTGKESKPDRIRGMAQAYSNAEVLWSDALFKAPITEKSDGDSYDLLECLRGEFENYPSVSHDDLLDAHAGAFELTNPHDWKKETASPRAVLSQDPSVWRRESILRDSRDDPYSNTGRYDPWEGATRG